jgi:hypothetical protein
MTVAEAGVRDGCLIEITDEIITHPDAETPELKERAFLGHINADLSVGTDVTKLTPLKSNEGLSCNGMMLAGQGFKISGAERALLLRTDGDAAEKVIRPYLGGGELLRRSQGNYVIDLFGLTERDARLTYPAVYSHVLATVKPERDENRRPALKNRWWVFGEPRRTFRPAIEGLERYIARPKPPSTGYFSS